MRATAAKIAAGLLAAAILSACGSENVPAPQLAAPPTRTPAPLAPTLEPLAPTPIRDWTVLDLSASVLAFLDAAEGISPLERSVVFNQQVALPHPECSNITFYPGTQLVQVLDRGGLDLVSTDLSAWRQAEAEFPAAALVATIGTELARVTELLPMASDQTPHICLLPVPPWAPPDELPHGGVGAQALGPDLILIWCARGALCSEAVGPQLAYQVAYAYQIAAAGLDISTVTLLDLALLHGRAADVALALYPDAMFDWAVTLESVVEAELWGRMRDYLGTTYQDYPDHRKIERFLYGRGSAEYPAAGGLFIGLQIVRAFHATHPEVSYAALAQMPAQDLLRDSGYDPR